MWRCPHEDHNDELTCIEDLVVHLLEHQLKLEKIAMATQADIDTFTATLGTVDTEVLALIAANEAAGSPLDFTAFQSALSKLATDAAPVVSAPVIPADPTDTGVVTDPSAPTV